jgi:hypothetical protein
MKSAIKSVKECFESDNVKITKIIQAKSTVRIDARVKSHEADKSDLFSKWVSFIYADKLAKENYGKSVTELNVYNSY